MGCANSYQAYKARKDAKAKSDEIDEYIRKDALRLMNRYSFLVQGHYGSGRSTFVKQLNQCYYGYGYDEKDCYGYKSRVFLCIIGSMRNLLLQMKHFNIPFTNDSLSDHDKLLKTVCDGMEFSLLNLSGEVGEAINALWADDGVQECFNRRYEIQGNRYFWKLEYYMGNFDEIRKPSYIPSFQDILRAGVTLTGGVSESLVYGRGQTFQFIDPRLRYTKPNRWLRHFQDVDAVLYFIDLSDYDQWLHVEEGSSDLLYRLDQFEEFCRNPHFFQTDVVLLLNKKFLFEEKLSKRPLTLCFPEYQGGNDCNAAYEYVRMQCEKRFVNTDSRSFYVHFTSALNGPGTMFIFDCIADVLLQCGLRKSHVRYIV